MEFIKNWFKELEAGRQATGRPLVRLCYAQSMDGSLTAHPGEPTTLSGPESSELTHWLRAAHDAILVGVGTVLADDPRLTVRLVAGRDPQPVILDSRLRTPARAFLIRKHPLPAWIATTNLATPKIPPGLAGVRILDLPPAQNGQVSLPGLLDCLGELGVRRLMVEGGAQVLTSFMAQRLADHVILTIAPKFIGGLHLGDRFAGKPGNLLTVLESAAYHRLGDDLIVLGKF
jgi:riboflavin-specific deaminase-like protein